MFWHFCEKFKNLKWPQSFGPDKVEREKIFQNGAEYLAKVPAGPKIPMKSLYRTSLWRKHKFSEKVQKFKMAAIF